MAYNAYFNPGGLSGTGVVNTRAWRFAEVPSANAHASARGVARIYTVLAAGGISDGQVIVDPGALAAATTEQVYGHPPSATSAPAGRWASATPASASRSAM